MDSPHLLHLGFLLLALAAPDPSIAMSTVGPADGTGVSSSVSTAVTVYHCMDCKSSECPLGNFKKIAETKNKTFSDVIIELVTNKTHTTICFEQANSCIEGVYKIFWNKAEGAGLSYGILNSEENGRGNISTEKNICCEIETDIWRNNLPLRCYTQKSSPKLTMLPVGIPERIQGDPESLTSENKTGIFAFLFVAACTGCAITYYLWLRRRQALRQDRLLIEKNPT